jgi:hypothetical protein
VKLGYGIHKADMKLAGMEMPPSDLAAAAVYYHRVENLRYLVLDLRYLLVGYDRLMMMLKWVMNK